MITVHFLKFPGRFAPVSRLFLAVVSLLLLSSSVSNLVASSPDAWAEFRNDVKMKMEKEVKTKFASYGIFVEPHGSDSYGVAIASGVSAGAKQPLTIIGIYDKQSQKLEIVEIEGMRLKDKKIK